ncbi:MAG: hypothetical protein ACTHOU_09390, partial [Aureliella sp.]
MKKSYRGRMNLDDGFEGEVDGLVDGHFDQATEEHFDEPKETVGVLDDDVAEGLAEDLDPELIEEGDLADLEEEVTSTNDPV